MADEEKRHTEQDLMDIAADLIQILKPYGFKICELRKIAEHMSKAIDHITYGP